MKKAPAAPGRQLQAQDSLATELGEEESIEEETGPIGVLEESNVSKRRYHPYDADASQGARDAKPRPDGGVTHQPEHNCS